MKVLKPLDLAIPEITLPQGFSGLLQCNPTKSFFFFFFFFFFWPKQAQVGFSLLAAKRAGSKIPSFEYMGIF